MKRIKSMSQAELAAYIQDALHSEGIHVVLSGGSAVSFYSGDQYVSKDLDLVNAGFARRSKIKSIMETLGFTKKGRYFLHLKRRCLWSFPMVRFRWAKNPWRKSANSSCQRDIEGVVTNRLRQRQVVRLLLLERPAGFGTGCLGRKKSSC